MGNNIGNIKPIENGKEFGIKSENSPFVSSFYFSDFYDEKAIKRFTKNTERLIRSSKEYKTYIELLRANVNVLNHDSILGNITNADVDLEFHHYPFSLYDIIEIMMNYCILNDENFTSFSLAKRVMEEHYHHIIGLVSLTETTHELSHSGNLFLNEKQVFGNYKEFIKKYKNGIPISLMEKINEMEKYSKLNIASDFKRLL